MYKRLIRPLLFCMEPEKAHHLVFGSISLLFRIPGMSQLISALYSVRNQKHGKRVMGLHFSNPVGLAAGFDKDALLFEELGAFGFGFIEVGTVTPRPQEGNPKPRMFRLKADRGLINRMGFNNKGLSQVKDRLRNRKPGGPLIGGNIGKNKDTPNDKAGDDYELGLSELYPYVDYFVVNVSSPNTPGLRTLQEKGPLTELLNRLLVRNKQLGNKPILLKIAPDLTDGQLDDIAEIVNSSGITGVIATNTTISREGLLSPPDLISEAGGLSGAPLRKRSTEVIRALRTRCGSEKVIIGVGGVFSADDAREKLDAGADLIQVYTGFIYEGPGIVKNILKGL
ncbi:MAG: hypothetical protein RLZZ630_636 [Bacteroidota bacterium]